MYETGSNLGHFTLLITFSLAFQSSNLKLNANTYPLILPTSLFNIVFILLNNIVYISGLTCCCQQLLLKELTLASTSLHTLVCLHEQESDFSIWNQDIYGCMWRIMFHVNTFSCKQVNSRLVVHLRKPKCQELLSVSSGSSVMRERHFSLRGVLIKNRFLLGGW